MHSQTLSSYTIAHCNTWTCVHAHTHKQHSTVMQHIYILPYKETLDFRGSFDDFTNIDHAVTQPSLPLETLNTEHGAKPTLHKFLQNKACLFPTLYCYYIVITFLEGDSRELAKPHCRWTITALSLSRSLSPSLSLPLPFLTSHAGRQYLGAGKNSAAEVGDRLWCAEQMEGGNGEYQ